MASTPSSPALLSAMSSSSNTDSCNTSATRDTPCGPKSLPARSSDVRVLLPASPRAKPDTPAMPKPFPRRESFESTGFKQSKFSKAAEFCRPSEFLKLPGFDDKSRSVMDLFLVSASKSALPPTPPMPFAAKLTCTSELCRAKTSLRTTAPASPSRLQAKSNDMKRSLRTNAAATPLAHSGPAPASFSVNHSEPHWLYNHSAKRCCRSAVTGMH
mmetsp:Transcript_29164/g.67121  ORF Transcript_29164/g.67121 Transcript_29164/m.67121 type:complete len:214 (+) Transcript_29164:1525-2166(+)